jgi:hypothetical protein
VVSETDGHLPGGEELLRLLGAAQEWAARTFPPPADHETTCQWCPLCRLMAVARGERPEVSERLAEAGGAVVAALRTLFDGAGTPEPDEPRVQRIDLGED